MGWRKCKDTFCFASLVSLSYELGYILEWSENNFLFKINFPGVKKVGIWSENTFESGLAWLQTKMFVLPPSSGLSDPNSAKFAITSKFQTVESRK